MYDTVNLRLTADNARGVSFIEETPCYLSDVGTHQYDDGEVTVTGYLDGLRVTVNRLQVKVKDGSLCKWYLGDNFKSMGRRDVQEAFERLSDELHLPMSKAAVTRLDVACNLIMQHSIDNYINHLGVLAYSKRLLQPNGVYYSKANEQLTFYDKNREYRSKGYPIPELYQGRNVLRYEMRLIHRLAAVLGVSAVTGATLYDEAFYSSVLKRWKDSYNAIQKINDIQLKFNAMRGKQGLYRFGVVALIEHFGGEVSFLNQISEAQGRGEIDRKQAHDLRNAVKRALQEREDLTVKSESVNELTKKVAEAVRFYR